jgi:hypothetical protein
MNNKITPIVGQVWGRRICKTNMTANEIKISRLSQSRVHATEPDRWINRNVFIEDWLFIPQNDLEWLAVNVDEWCRSDGLFNVIRNHTVPVGYTFTMKVGHTERQWQNMRYELGLDEKPTINRNPQPGTAFASSMKVIKKEAEMSTEKMIPIDYANSITPIVIGDGYYNSGQKFNKIVDQSILDRINNASGESLSNDHLFITSFTDRPNTGTQPVGDDVVVDMQNDVDPFPAYFVLWAQRKDEMWKPNHAAMLKQHQAKQGVHIDDGGDLAVGSEKVGVATPVFTQAMADASNLPKAGADCRYKLIGGVNWFDCRVIHYHKNYVWIENLTTGSSPLIKINTLLFLPPKPIQTDEEKLRELMLGEFLDLGFHADDITNINSLMNSDKFTITLKG